MTGTNVAVLRDSALLGAKCDSPAACGERVPSRFSGEAGEGHVSILDIISFIESLR
jgi:hypothetical protein